MRKASSYCALVMIALLVFHTIPFCLGLQFGDDNMAVFITTSIIDLTFVAVFLVHAVLSIVLFAKSLKDKRAQSVKKSNSYVKLNVATYARRITGVLILLLFASHALIYSHFIPNSTSTIDAIPDLAFTLLITICLFVHVIVSIRPLFVGIGADVPLTVTRVIQLVFAILGVVCIYTIIGYLALL